MQRITRSLLLWLTLGFVVALTCLLDPTSARAVADTLDQSQPAQNSLGQIGSGGGTGEVFTAGRSGYLYRVRLYLGLPASGATTGAVNVNIQTVTSDGLPSGTLIGNGSIPVEKISTSGGWVEADNIGAFVTAGTQYALLLSTGNGIVSWYMEIGGDVKPYPAGYWVSQAGGAWQKILTNQDWTFQTYVVPDTLDQNQSQTSGTGGGTRALGTTPVGQTFTVGLHGLLDRISVYLTNSSTNPAPITVTILKVGSNGLPVSGTQVATGTIPAAAIPQPYARSWASAGITPLTVKPGERYAILLSTAGSGVQWVMLSNVYSGGTQIIRNGTSWAATSSDFAFQTYVLMPILDQAQTVFEAAWNTQNGEPLAQYVTAHVTGLLDHVTLLLDRRDYPPPTADPTVQIYTVPSATELDSRLLGSATIPLSSIKVWQMTGDIPGWLDVSFSGVNVTAGNQYSIVLAEASAGMVGWGFICCRNVYSGGHALWTENGSLVNEWGTDMAFRTYVLPVPQILTRASYGITPCRNGVCPGASGGFNPADLTEGVKSHFQFLERPNGTVQGILNFNDLRPDGITLRGCTTESAACALTVTTLACTGTQSMMIAGTFTPRRGATTHYTLNLAEAPDGPGTFSLTAGDYSYTLTLNGIVKVTCPPPATVGGP